MTAPSGLGGRRILVLEDDFYLADDLAQALQRAGAHIVGPCARVADARALLDDAPIDAAVLDVNVVDGRSFDLARAITARGIPAMFVTGYDSEAIPADLVDVPRLQKPVSPPRVVAAVADLVAGR